MKNDNIEELFKSLDFDFAEPSNDHREKFRARLKQRSRGKIKRSGVIALWMPVMSIAATFLVAFLLFKGVFDQDAVQSQDLASVSTEMKNTQNFYSGVIKKELYNLELEKTPETEAVIEDALKQLEILEKDYEKLKTDLAKSGQDRRVIHAMISNFQKRIDLLNHVLEKINTIKELKNAPNENYIL